ncbi:MAG: hypothetical protein D6737_08360 [Chloroflexi bacterium]|nr:MAG: hypothetical protein D6737_08360 [Chloroflexota bacterium]
MMSTYAAPNIDQASDSSPPDETQKSIHILITQCLQNGFFLADENRLALSTENAMRILVGNQEGFDLNCIEVGADNRRRLIDEGGKDFYKNGPLYKFFDAVTHPDPVEEDLHIIHIRDWHEPSNQYDNERKLYGPHCEGGTWYAEPIDGFDEFLCPWGDDRQKQIAARQVTGYRPNPHVTLTYYDVRSDSVFDFRPPDSPRLLQELDACMPNRAVHQSQLEMILDRLIGPRKKGAAPSVLNERRVYVVVIGVYTDIKIQTLLVGLQSRYNIPNLIVSDVLTASQSLERHLQGLDFASKVLQVEVIHPLNDLVSTLNLGAVKTIPQELLRNSINYRNYQSYFLDKQNLLSYQDQKLVSDIEMTRRSTEDLRNTTERNNKVLYYSGIAFLILAILSGIVNLLSGIDEDIQGSVAFTAVAGGLSASQLILIFFVKPIKQLEENLANLVRLRNYLETYSLITALMRYHFTKAERLHYTVDEEKDRQQLESLERQIKMIQETAKEMRNLFGHTVPDDSPDGALIPPIETETDG